MTIHPGQAFYRWGLQRAQCVYFYMTLLAPFHRVFLVLYRENVLIFNKKNWSWKIVYCAQACSCSIVSLAVCLLPACWSLDLVTERVCIVNEAISREEQYMAWKAQLHATTRAGSSAVRIDPLRFLAGCRKRQLNQALSVHSPFVPFLSVCVVLLTRAPFCIVLFCVIYVFCSLLVVLVRLSIPVQVIDWKDSSPEWPIMCWWGR